jgi:hypothetical protein
VRGQAPQVQLPPTHVWRGEHASLAPHRQLSPEQKSPLLVLHSAPVPAHRQTPPWHTAPDAHATPHPPQCMSLVMTSVSQLRSSMSQSRKLPEQARTWQPSARHSSLAFGMAHGVPQVTQFVSVRTESQSPSAPQSAKPELQVMTQVPVEQLSDPFGSPHGLLHAPQF